MQQGGTRRRLKEIYREGKLAETAPKRPLALTIGAAAVTLVVILGVLAGPSVVTCFNSPDGMGQCLRGKMAEVGLIPAAPQPAVAETEAPAEPEAEVAAATVDEAVSAEPELDVTPPAETEVAEVDEVIAATFGLLRAEPDGSVVIAGSGTPGSRVEVFANGELLGAVEVESSGDWVFVPEAPLPPGGLEITLGEEGKPGAADESFVVVINEDKTSQPLVVASRPGEASEVLQGLTAPTQVAEAPEPAMPAEPAPAAPAEPASTEPTVADVTDAEAVEDVAEADTAEAQPAPAAETPSETGMEVAALSEPTAPEAASAQADAVEAPEAATAATEPGPVEPVDAGAPQVATTEAPEPDSAPVPEADEPAQPAASVAQPAEQPAAAQQPATEQPAPAAVAAVPPTIDAIEIETDRTFFAGAGPEGGVIRLYVDDTFVADAPIENGRWLVEAGPVLDQPSQRVRADLLADGSAEVVARAEVDFVVDVPAAEEPVTVAETDMPEAPAEETASEPAVPSAPEPEAEVQPAPAPPETPAPAEPAVTPEPPTPAEPAVEPEPAPEPTPAEPSPVAEPDVPTMVAVSLGDPDAQRFASGKAIIRRGDNLWTIARRVYGEGLKYTTIYQANTGQIRDPDQIYPGQVFDLPGGEGSL